MKPIDLLHETYAGLSANLVRSGLTILGIVIGISSVIAMVSLGNGASSSIQSNIQSLGSNLIEIMPGSQKGPGQQVSAGFGSARSLTTDDADAIASQVADVSAVAEEVNGRYQITAKGTNTNTTVIGTTDNYPAIRNVSMDTGSWFSADQNSSAAKVAVIGPTVRDTLYGSSTDPTGQPIRIKGLEFKVLGVTVAKGGSGFNNPDTQIYIPLVSAQRYLVGNEYLGTIDVQADSQAAMTQVQSDITTLLLDRHKISDASNADFRIINQQDLVSSATSIVSTFTIFLGAVAGISLVVGGIGIMNMMLTTVTERTREIGLRKAIGAKQYDIRTQFLAEAVLLTVTGGILGTALGWLIASVISTVLSVSATVTLSSVLLACGVSALIGIVFGYYPAARAARLNPIEALRYE